MGVLLSPSRGVDAQVTSLLGLGFLSCEMGVVPLNEARKVVVRFLLENKIASSQRIEDLHLLSLSLLGMSAMRVKGHGALLGRGRVSLQNVPGLHCSHCLLLLLGF